MLRYWTKASEVSNIGIVPNSRFFFYRSVSYRARFRSDTPTPKHARLSRWRKLQCINCRNRIDCCLIFFNRYTIELDSELDSRSISISACRSLLVLCFFFLVFHLRCSCRGYRCCSRCFGRYCSCSSCSCLNPPPAIYTSIYTWYVPSGGKVKNKA